MSVSATVTKLLGADWMALLQLGLSLIEIAQRLAAAEGKSAAEFRRRRKEIETARGKTVDAAIKALK